MCDLSELWPFCLFSDSGTRSVSRLLLSLPPRADHSHPASKPWNGAESQSYERTNVSITNCCTTFQLLLPRQSRACADNRFSVIDTELNSCFSSDSGLFWTSWFRQRKITSKTSASWWRWEILVFIATAAKTTTVKLTMSGKICRSTRSGSRKCFNRSKTHHKLLHTKVELQSYSCPDDGAVKKYPFFFMTLSAARLGLGNCVAFGLDNFYFFKIRRPLISNKRKSFGQFAAK